MNLPKGYGYVEFKTRADAEKAQLYMDGVRFTCSRSLIICGLCCFANHVNICLVQAQIDGNVVRAKFTLPPRQKLLPPQKPVTAPPKRDTSKAEIAGDAEKDGLKQQRECMPSATRFLF